MTNMLQHRPTSSPATGPGNNKHAAASPGDIQPSTRVKNWHGSSWQLARPTAPAASDSTGQRRCDRWALKSLSLPSSSSASVAHSQVGCRPACHSTSLITHQHAQSRARLALPPACITIDTSAPVAATQGWVQGWLVPAPQRVTLLALKNTAASAPHCPTAHSIVASQRRYHLTIVAAVSSAGLALSTPISPRFTNSSSWLQARRLRSAIALRERTSSHTLSLCVYARLAQHTNAHAGSRRGIYTRI
jgi:hypothetical protein